ncbi:glycosyltransferase [bacterium]|nr:glycosyltransferase [bacterium]
MIDEIYNPSNVKQADLVVGIPSYSEASTISFVTEQVSRGLKEYYPRLKSVIINVDNNSPDNTKGAFLSSKSEIPLIYISTPQGVKGKGYNFYNLFSLFRELKAKVGIVVDADLKSIKPIWVKHLAEPIFSGKYKYAAPFYARKKDDATITNQIVFPLVYGLFGVNIRQPIGGEFSFSNELVDFWLNQKWSEQVNQYGIDVFMSTYAILSEFPLCQVNLINKIHKPSAPNLGPMFIQVASTLFGIINDNIEKIKLVEKVKEVSMLGEKDIPKIENTIPDSSHFKKLFQAEFGVYRDILGDCISKEIIEQIQQENGKTPQIGVDVWIKIIYDSIYCFNKEKDSEIIKALRSLYFGRVAHFFEEIAMLSPEESEKKVLEQANYFFEKRDYLLNKL